MDYESRVRRLETVSIIQSALLALVSVVAGFLWIVREPPRPIITSPSPASLAVTDANSVTEIFPNVLTIDSPESSTVVASGGIKLSVRTDSISITPSGINVERNGKLVASWPAD